MSEVRTTMIPVAMVLPERTLAKAQAEYDAARRFLTDDAVRKLDAAEDAIARRVIEGR